MSIGDTDNQAYTQVDIEHDRYIVHDTINRVDIEYDQSIGRHTDNQPYIEVDSEYDQSS